MRTPLCRPNPGGALCAAAVLAVVFYVILIPVLHGAMWLLYLNAHDYEGAFVRRFFRGCTAFVRCR